MPLLQMPPQRPAMQNRNNRMTSLGGGVKPSPYGPSGQTPPWVPPMTPGSGGYPEQSTGPVNRPDYKKPDIQPNQPRMTYPDMGGMPNPGTIMPGPVLDGGGMTAPPMTMPGGMYNSGAMSSLGGPSPDMMSMLLKKLTGR